MMFGTKNTTISRYTARKIAEGMNCWAGKEYRKDIITADEVLKLQWGDVTILAWVRENGDVRIQHVCW